jgi:hypothetical protein
VAELRRTINVNLIRVCGFLMQTKVYLFWKRGLEITVMAELVD